MIQEDYLACNLYQNKPAHPTQPNFTQFFDEKNSLYYFAYVANGGTVLLKSEGYPQQKSCETGIAAVVKNKEITERFAVKNEGKKFYLSLKAGNNREIARSCDFATEAEATAAIVIISAPIVVAKATKTTVKVAAPKTTSAKVEAPKVVVTKTEIVAPKATEKKVETKKATVAKTEVEAPKATAATTKNKTAAPKASKNAAFLNENDYLGHDTLWFGDVQTGYTKFAKNTNFFFAVYNPDGSLYLSSEAFATENKRNEIFVETVQSIENGELYSVKEIEGKFFSTLLNVENKELARSAAFDNYTSAFVTTPIGRTRVEATLY